MDEAKSRVSAQSLAAFLACQPSADLLTVPGIGPKSKAILEKEGISCIEDLVKLEMPLFEYLKSILPNVNVHSIVFSVKNYRKKDKEQEPILGEDFEPSLIDDLEESKKRCCIS